MSDLVGTKIIGFLTHRLILYCCFRIVVYNCLFVISMENRSVISVSFLQALRRDQFLCLFLDKMPPHGKANNLHRQKQRRRSASRLKLISAFVYATWIVHFLSYLNPKFQASSSFLCLYRPVCVGPVRKPHCWFSHEAAQI